MSEKKLRELEVSKIILTDSKRWTNSVVKRSEFICYDTETYQGKCKLICDSNNRFLYNPTFDEVLDFMWYKSGGNYYRAFYNIDFDLSSIFKIWNDIELIDKLIHGEIVNYENYRLYYIRPKMFRMSKGKKSVYFVDLYAMFKRSLNSASKDFLNDTKLDVIDSARLNTDLVYWVKNLKDIILYCKKDAELTARLGNELVKEIQECKLLLPKFFTSHASLSKQYFRKKARIPSLKFVPTNVLDIAYQTYYGGRFEVLKRGSFEKLYSYDINSAYPDTIKDLPSLKYGIWKQVKEINPNECIGFYNVMLDIPSDIYISAFPIRHKGVVVFPSGIFATWITWYEADLLKEYIKGISYGYEYFPDKREYKPFKTGIEYLYSQKAKFKDVNDVFYFLIKLTMNSLYGCFLEKHKKIDGLVYSGILFNSVYASIITAKCRWKLLKDVGIDNWEKIVAFHTDSVITTEPIKLKMDTKIGNWSDEGSGAGLILGTGVYQIGKKIRRRCFSSKKIDWYALLVRRLAKDTVKVKYTKVLKIAEALKRYHSLDDVNKWIEGNKKLRINSDRKRTWDDNFINCADVLSRNISSKTMALSYIRNDNLK